MRCSECGQDMGTCMSGQDRCQICILRSSRYPRSKVVRYVKAKEDKKMSEQITLTFKMDKEIKENLYKFCAAKGLKIGRFLEQAITNEVKREKLKEQLILDFEAKGGKL